MMAANIAGLNVAETFLLLETFEKGLNFIGYIPVIGSLGAGARTIYAKIEAIAGIALLALSVGLSVGGNTNHLYTSVGGTLLGHAILNGIRSLFEMVPFVALASTLPYDLLTASYVGGRLFSYIK